YFPQDSVICEATVTSSEVQIKFLELDLAPSSRYKTQGNLMSMDSTTKGNYEHFMLKEIHEQPALVDKLAAFYIKGEGRAQLDSLKGFKVPAWHLAACGTAWHAGLMIKNYFEQLNRQRASVEIAS